MRWYAVKIRMGEETHTHIVKAADEAEAKAYVVRHWMEGGVIVQVVGCRLHQLQRLETRRA